jgi:hypothetical protein
MKALLGHSAARQSKGDPKINYVVVQVKCRVFGTARVNLPPDSWFGHDRCPRCQGTCECEYLGHGFTSEHLSAPETNNFAIAQHSACVSWSRSCNVLVGSRAECGKNGGVKGEMMPLKKSKCDEEIETRQNALALEQQIMQPVVHTVQEAAFVHCYLKCGHMVTVHKVDLEELPSFSIECWACELTSQKRFHSPERTTTGGFSSKGYEEGPRDSVH